MKKLYRLLLFTVIFLVFALAVYFPAHKQARAHVNYVTAVEDHPLNCFSCHLYISKNGFISKLINKDYLSPFNLTVSKDGRRLYIVAQEGNALLVADAEKQILISKRLIHVPN